MKQAASQELLSYWNQLRGSRMEPDRSELDPGEIRGVLANTFILEVDEQLGYPMRIAGTRLSTLFTTELKGSNFTELWDPESRKSVHELLACVLDDRHPVLAGVLTAPAGFPPLELELLLLPLRHFGKTHARVIGSLAPCFIPQWLGIVRSPGLQITSMRIIRRPADAVQPPPEKTGHPQPASQRYGHLTVLDGGRTDGPTQNNPC